MELAATAAGAGALGAAGEGALTLLEVDPLGAVDCGADDVADAHPTSARQVSDAMPIASQREPALSFIGPLSAANQSDPRWRWSPCHPSVQAGVSVGQTASPCEYTRHPPTSPEQWPARRPTGSFQLGREHSCMVRLERAVEVTSRDDGDVIER